MKLLELFSGTKSVGKVAEQLGYEVISLDLKDADINCNILDWDYTTYPVGYFDVIWASPPCTEYSKAKSRGIRNIDEANRIVLKTLEIIEYLNPTYHILENPQTGLLKNQPFMYGISYKDLDYCKYGMQYRKRTRLWNNVFNWIPRELCKKDCGNMVNNRHIGSCGCGGQGQGHKTRYSDRSYRREEKYVIPIELIEELFSCIDLDLR